MAGYLGTKAVLLSTTAADVTGDAEIGGDLTVGGNLTSTGIDDNATATAITIDSSGNVGIGGAAASGYNLDVNGALTVGGNFNANTDTNGGGVNIGFDTTSGGTISSLDPGIAWYPLDIAGADLRFSTVGAERMRIDSSGNLLVGTTSPTTTGVGGATFYPTSFNRTILSLGSTTTGNGAEVVWFYNPNGRVGRIETNASSTSYITSSDYRLKTDAQPMTGASARVQALNPVNFEWIVDGSRVDGFLAHEAQEVVPEAVSGTKDAMRDEEYEVTPAVLDDDGNVVTEAVMGTRSVPDYQGIDQSKLVPLLTAALQEALTEIADLKARVTALEAV